MIRRFALPALLAVVGLTILVLPALAQNEAKSAQADSPALAEAAPATSALPDLDELIPPPTLGFNPTVGSWVRYRLEDKLANTSREFTLAVVGREHGQGNKGAWIEISLEAKNEVQVVIRALLLVNEAGRPAVKQLFLRTGNHHAVKLDVNDFPDKQQAPAPTYDDLGEATVEVEAGTFATQRYRRHLPDGNVQNIWASPSLAPFGVVRSLSHAYEMELIAYGHDYQAQTIESPYQLTPENPRAQDSVKSGD